jgi:Flp pilus assembly pilin Flp
MRAKEFLRKVIKDEKGQSIPEYALLLTLVGGAAVGISQLSDQIKEIFDQATAIFQQIAETLRENSANLNLNQ